jgi:hypothetical protein
MRTWRERTEHSRHSFTWPAPGLSLGAPETFELRCPQLPPGNFALLLFRPEHVDTLELSSHPHRRQVDTLENGSWTETAVNP